MLVLSRKSNQGILIKGKDGDVRIVVLETERGKVRLGIEAPKGHIVIRDELIHEIRVANEQSALKNQENIRMILGE